MGPFARSLLGLAAFLLCGAPARGAEPPRVGIVGLPADDPLVWHLRVELSELDFDLVVLEASSGEPLDALEGAARAAGVTAAILVRQRSSPVLEIWVLDRVTGKLVRRTIDTTGTTPEPRVVALRAIELLRASLRELDAPTPPPTGEVEVSRPVAALLADPPALVELTLGIGGLASPGEVPPNLVLPIQIRLIPPGRWGLMAFGAAPLSAAQVREPDYGSALVRPVLAGGGVLYRLRPEHARWQLVTAAGAGGAWVWMSGSARSPYSSRVDVASAPMVFGALGFEPRLTRALRVPLAATLGTTLPAVSVAFADAEVATWGQPFALVSVGLGLDLD